MAFSHGILERHSWLLLVGIILVVSIGGLVEIAPLFWIGSTIEKVQGIRPYSPLELRGRDIYIREGCYLCHSQMVRSLRDEIERYGNYSLAAESKFDHPFQWGSKRTGPDLARLGGKYSDDWHRAHLINPRGVVPESVMPGYPFLANTELGYDDITARMGVLRLADGKDGYTEEQIANAKVDLEAQAAKTGTKADDVLKRYPKAVARAFDGDASKITEMDALIAYLQVLGTMADFTKFDKTQTENLR